MSSHSYNLEEIDAIIFDLGGVILNLDYNLTIDAFKKLGGDNFDQLYTQAQQDKIFDKYEVGAISSDQFVKYLYQFLPKEISDNQIISAWNCMLLDLPKERIELILKLKKDYKVFLFSNTNDLHYKSYRGYLKSEFGDSTLLEKTFDKTYFSHLVHERKPNAAAFQLVLDEHKLDPSRTLFIDDSIQHIEGANNIAINTIHLENSDILEIF